ncbi:hypothetical protein [Fundidesulfovibrio soli]|uniref:hypothetical protein n=1 Tax=Fundidesulfovibrio soli TaxID=2922716 RepID=UPI001FAFAD32|nr:hypothetical protein [Fundidesulfovibrio soli]
MSGAHPIFWDGLGLEAPAGWEPAALGKGYLRLDDADGPRLTLRWQRVKPGSAPAGVLGRLKRKYRFAPDDAPGPMAAKLGEVLAPGGAVLACLGPDGGEAVLCVLPGLQGAGGADLAVLAVPHAHPAESAEPWLGCARTLRASDPGLLRLYDVSAQAPPGFTLAECSVQLGHFRFLFRAGRSSLEYHRFAPAQAILRGTSLEAWAGKVFPDRRGKARVFVPGRLQGPDFAAALHPPAEVQAGAARRLAARWLPALRLLRAAVWLGDESRILAVLAVHTGELSPQFFKEVCARYVVQTPPR